MADNKKYYYMRLKENYFDSDEQKVLEAMPDGYLYSNILLKLYLKSLKRNGLLMFTDKIPYNAQMIAAATQHQVGTVEKALEIFKELGIIEVLDNGAIYMADVQNFVGQASTEADRVRDYRLKISAAKALENGGCTNVQEMYDKCTPEIRVQRLEIRDQSTENKVGVGDLPATAAEAQTLESFASNNLSGFNSVCFEEFGEYMKEFPDDMIRYAIAEAGAHGKPYWAYVRKILQRWQNEHITTLEQAKLSDKKPVQAAQPQTATKVDMNYTQHDYGSSDYDWLNNPNSDLERLYGGN